jgi:hypothetical protein
MMVLMLGSVLLGTAVAAQAAEQPIGTVVGVPMWELDAFLRANALPGNDAWGNVLPANSVTVLHVAPEFNSSIATVAVTRQDTGQAAPSVYFPTFGNSDMARMYRQINAHDTWSPSRLVGEGYTAVVEVEVVQLATGSWTPGRTKFMLVPAEQMVEIVAANPPGTIRPVHRQRSQIGGGGNDREVVLMAIDATSLLASGAATVQIPSATIYPLDLARLIRSLNSNVSLQDPGPGPMTTAEVR